MRKRAAGGWVGGRIAWGTRRFCARLLEWGPRRKEPSVKVVFVLGLGLFLAVAGCGSGGPEAGSPGAYGGPCSEDGTCDEGLVCVNHVCKNAP